ncbi:hypothetical protein BDW59DRAFT_173698 [Aspergillus cavernicola]|uniref:Protein NO VEIN C-terminal domain-containing protein n=1 Tax=Aspergillus cavernicola TaxID=176166 RepID=A0ABR4I4R7_9EURO
MSETDAQTSSDAHSAARKSARELVKSIAKEHGHLGEEILSQMSPEVRREVEEALLRKDEMIGTSVITLAKNLYTSSARFVFELLQNADDNSYIRAKSASAAPFVSFRVYSRRIVLECNEDGFTRENLIAICNVGQSSKSGAQGYIGEKGIGFKSVFMVASKVLIQSGHFSFYFQHKSHDSGMGMISPMWEETDEILDAPLTRITLYLHESGSYENLAKERATTLQQFQELQATFLLFMKNLRRIEVTIYDHDDNQPVSSTTFSMEQQDQDRVELRKKTEANGEAHDHDHSQQYHIIRETTSDLPQNENRRYTDAELAEGTYAKTEVVLAFPLTRDYVPIVEPQEVFAFLPVRTMGFPFLMQSDFVTDASRQDIVKSSARNACLLAAAARVLVLAISQFCNHPTLRFQWMRYLPNDKQHSWDPFWTRFLDNIRSNLKITPTLWTKSHRKLRCIEDMRRVPSTMEDKNGEPLFADLDVEQYLAVEYLEKDLGFLTDHGLAVMRKTEFLARVRQDLNQEDEESIMFDPNTDADWHSRVAKSLIDCWPRNSNKMKDLALIPLANGERASAETVEDSPIYFSKVSRYSIPARLDLKSVDPKAEENPARRKLFSLLGVREVGASHIRRMIIKHHEKRTPSLRASKSTVAFLYLTAHLDQENDNADAYKHIKLWDQLFKVRVARSSTIYFPTDDQYGAQQLFQPLDTEDNTGDLTLDVSILDPAYMSECPVQPEEESLTWKDWLSEKLNVQDVISLANDDDLTKECRYVAEHHPERFVGFLLKYWKSNEGHLVNNQAVINKLLKIEVLCENGDLYPLGKVYVRSEKLEYASGFLREDEFFPWLKQDASSKDISGFSDLDTVAKVLGFGYPKSELEFYLTTLSFIVGANTDARKNAFESQDLIYAPANDYQETHWACPSLCLWEAPAFMFEMSPLKSLYREVKDKKYIAELFHTTLEIPDASIDNFVDQLSVGQGEGWDSLNEIYETYQKMDELCPQMDSDVAKKIRDEFEDGELIYHKAKDGNWHSPSKCLWSSATDIQGMVTLNDIYEDLPRFFIKLLGVQTLTLEIIYDKLVNQGRGGSCITEVKQTIWILNSYLQEVEELPDPEDVISNKVFPVKYSDGTVELCSFAVDFAIADRKHLADLFLGKAKFLDFEINDIAQLEPFLCWAGLKSRYLSASVKEISALSGDSHRSLTSTDRDISRKAHGLLRIAVHFKSPRIKQGEQAFYELLKKIDVCESDGISSEIHLNQDREDIRIEVSRSELHFQETKDGLTIYVPRNKRDQYLCFLDRIPAALLEWIMTEPSTGICRPVGEIALKAMCGVLQPQNEYVAETLDRAGIMSVEIADDLVGNAAEIASEQNNDPRTPRRSNEYSAAWDAMSSTLYDASVVSADDETMTASYSRASQSYSQAVNAYTHSGHTRGPAPSLPAALEPIYQNTDSEYRRLLNNVINVARSAEFPGREPFDMPTLSQSLDGLARGRDTETYQLRTAEKIERDKMIGAAGEVFVFELLSSLDPGLPGYSRDNWQSTIRKYVRIHDDYAGMESWNGRETADITYNDTDGVLTSLLIDKGYLAPVVWSGARPYYYLEVKTTTLLCETPFYMSGSQYERMQRISLAQTGAEGQHSVYVIFRIFNVGQANMGMKVYVDPNLMRERRELSFTAETWSIVPGPGLSTPTP